MIKKVNRKYSTLRHKAHEGTKEERRKLGMRNEE
jgi:hypothetical protein